MSARGQAGEAEQSVDHAIDRHDTLDDEGAFALVDEARPQVGLTPQALAQQGFAETGGERTEVNVGHLL